MKKVQSPWTPAGCSEPLQINEIVKQGTVLAAKICSNTVDKLNHKLLQKGYGISIGDVKIPNMAFQDDIAQINTNNQEKSNQENVKQCIRVTEAFQHKKRMKFNASKTQVMKLNTENNPRIYAERPTNTRVYIVQVPWRHSKLLAYVRRPYCTTSITCNTYK